jgi:hypothetical protein
MTTRDHSDGIRLQAERVVRAYNELRGTAKHSDFNSDELPVGKFVELFKQIKRSKAGSNQSAIPQGIARSASRER